jgi:hypothetical protein
MRYALSAAFFLLSASGAFTQTKSPVEGVWKVTEVVMPPEKGTTITDPQPGLMIFTRGFYSTVIVMAEQPRAGAAPAKDPQNLTDAEKIARYEEWKPFGASAGAYEIKGSTLTRRVLVAKNAHVMTRGAPTIWEFKQEGPNTLWLIPTADLAVTEPRIKLTRLE